MKAAVMPLKYGDWIRMTVSDRALWYEQTTVVLSNTHATSPAFGRDALVGLNYSQPVQVQSTYLYHLPSIHYSDILSALDLRTPAAPNGFMTLATLDQVFKEASKPAATRHIFSALSLPLPGGTNLPPV